jgi:hypothetical protein
VCVSQRSTKPARRGGPGGVVNHSSAGSDAGCPVLRTPCAIRLYLRLPQEADAERRRRREAILHVHWSEAGMNPRPTAACGSAARCCIRRLLLHMDLLPTAAESCRQQNRRCNRDASSQQHWWLSNTQLPRRHAQGPRLDFPMLWAAHLLAASRAKSGSARRATVGRALAELLLSRRSPVLANVGGAGGRLPAESDTR